MLGFQRRLCLPGPAAAEAASSKTLFSSVRLRRMGCDEEGSCQPWARWGQQLSPSAWTQCRRVSPCILSGSQPDVPRL